VRRANGVAIYVGSETMQKADIERLVEFVKAGLALLDPKAELRVHSQGLIVPATSTIVSELQRELVYEKSFADTGLAERPVVFDLAHNIIRVNGIPKRLPPTEVRILRELMAADGFVFRAELARRLNPDRPQPVSTISTLVLRIRKKLDGYAGVLVSGKNTGYRFDHESPHIIILNPGKVN